MLKFMQAIGRERTHYGHKELYKKLMQNLSDSEQIEFQELYKAVIDSQIDSNGKCTIFNYRDLHGPLFIRTFRMHAINYSNT